MISFVGQELLYLNICVNFKTLLAFVSIKPAQQFKYREVVR